MPLVPQDHAESGRHSAKQVVITTAGPFEKYGQTLVKLCAEEGVDYADSTHPGPRTPVCCMNICY